jgi:4-hydroxyphenylpyruvate dioxygenase-like putative hemolysin
MPKPPMAYYELSKTRVAGHEEPIERMAKHGILIDGEGVVDGGETRILLQIFSKTVIGPIFFEFIQRKGDDGFGEGNFRALFESIEQDQIDPSALETCETRRADCPARLPCAGSAARLRGAAVDCIRLVYFCGSGLA